MATPPYRIVDKRTRFGSNTLHEAATYNSERATVADLSHDTQRNLSDVGRRVLMNISRKLFADYPVLENAILEQANLAVSHFLPQYYGRNQAWGKLAESWIVDEWLPICDVRGWPYDGNKFLELLVISELRDGDMGTLLTETADGYPMVQIIPSHRIRSPLGAGLWTAMVRFEENKLFVDGIQIDQGRPTIVDPPIEWEALLVDGEILGPQGQPIAHRVCEDGWYYGPWQDIPARNLFLSFHPKWTDQARGIPAIGSSAWDWQDHKESRRFDLMAQKVGAALYLIEHNETGDSGSAQALIQSAIRQTDENGTSQIVSPEVQSVKGGIRYFRTGSGSKIESPSTNRPGQQTQQFQADIMRDALAGVEWSYIFGVEPGKAGGASLRVVVDRINRVLEKRRKSPAKAFKRIVGYAISKAMKIGLLPWDDDWWMWEFQGPGRVTADRKYDSDVDIAEIEAGLNTRKASSGRRGDDWRDNDTQRAVETTADIQTAKVESAKLGITWQEYLAIYRPAKASAPGVPQPAEKDTADKPQEDTTKE